MGAGAGASWGADTRTMPEHCLHLIFLPTRLDATFVCHWHAVHVAEIIALEDDSSICPKTMGGAAFFGVPAAGPPGGVTGFGGGDN